MGGLPAECRQIETWVPALTGLETVLPLPDEPKQAK
tara:strand:- start:196 stop:303 length:108 start_codon:yes stop_codon:yes gene_type:complete